MIKFTVEGRPVPHVRMTQRGKYVKQNAARYIGYKQMVGLIAKRCFKKPSDKPIKIVVDVYLWGKQPPWVWTAMFQIFSRLRKMH
jgi:crossover junction endodeoxyribonuclease RusA